MIIKGATTPQNFQPRQRFTFTRGFETEFCVRVRNNLAAAQLLAFVGGGLEAWTEPEEGTPYTRVYGFAPDPSLGGGDGVTVPLRSSWNLIGQNSDQSLWLDPRIAAETAKFPATEAGAELLRRFKTSTEAIANGESEIDEVLISTNLTLEPGNPVALNLVSYVAFLQSLITLGIGVNIAEMVNFIQARGRGVESRFLATYSLQNTQSWLPAAAGAVAVANVNRVYTTAGLLATEASAGLNAGLIFGLPQGVWLKMAPQVVQQDDGSYVATREWYFAESYDQWVYGPPVA